VGESDERMAELAAQVAADPGAPGFALLAELHRRAGRRADAEQVLRAGLAASPDDHAARALLALVLGDARRGPEARAELVRVGERLVTAYELARVPAPSDAASALSEDELEDAFAQAETDQEQLIDPNRVAAEAILHADAGAADGLHEDAAESAYVPGQTFVTETMARLLDRQGDAVGAARIRAALAAETPRESELRPARAHRRRQTVAKLERWLSNLRSHWA
jgi:hypothetical protein